MSETQRYARVPAELGRAGWRRDAPHTAECGSVRGSGKSVAAALADLGSQLETIAKAARTDPTFWHDADNGLLTVAVPQADGESWVSYTVRLGQESGPVLATGTTHGGGDVREAYANAIGYARVERERYGTRAS